MVSAHKLLRTGASKRVASLARSGHAYVMQWTVITGASRGIGAAIALELAQSHEALILLGRNDARLRTVAERCRSQSQIPVKTLAFDLSSSGAVIEATSAILQILGADFKIHSLIHNAGVYEKNANASEWARIFAINLVAPVLLTEKLLPSFASPGSIVNVGSTLGIRPIGGSLAYSASKAALLNWTAGLALELAPLKIRVNAVCPGIVDTPIHQLERLSESEKESAIVTWKAAHPLGRAGKPEEIAKAVAFLASPASSWTTGATLTVDGGISL